MLLSNFYWLKKIKKISLNVNLLRNKNNKFKNYNFNTLFHVYSYNNLSNESSLFFKNKKNNSLFYSFNLLNSGKLENQVYSKYFIIYLFYNSLMKRGLSLKIIKSINLVVKQLIDNIYDTFLNDYYFFSANEDDQFLTYSYVFKSFDDFYNDIIVVNLDKSKITNKKFIESLDYFDETSFELQDFDTKNIFKSKMIKYLKMDIEEEDENDIEDYSTPINEEFGDFNIFDILNKYNFFFLIFKNNTNYLFKNKNLINWFLKITFSNYKIASLDFLINYVQLLFINFKKNQDCHYLSIINNFYSLNYLLSKIVNFGLFFFKLKRVMVGKKLKKILKKKNKFRLLCRYAAADKRIKLTMLYFKKALRLSDGDSLDEKLKDVITDIYFNDKTSWFLSIRDKTQMAYLNSTTFF